MFKKKIVILLKKWKTKKNEKKNHLRTRINIHAWFSLKKNDSHYTIINLIYGHIHWEVVTAQFDNENNSPSLPRSP